MSKKDTPLPCVAEMVNAILDGRKTQTRRPMKRQPPDWAKWYYWVKNEQLPKFDCPFGKPGDNLWVRETWQPWYEMSDTHCHASIRYKADAAFVPSKDDTQHNQIVLACKSDYNTDGDKPIDKWRPWTHMCRWASRIDLTVKSVRVERLNEISDEDAIAEGIDDSHSDEHAHKFAIPGPAYRFGRLWESLYGEGSFDDRWVWVIEWEPIYDPTR